MWDINATPEIFQGYSKEHEIFEGYLMERFQGYSNEQGAYRGKEGHLSISSLNFSFVLQAGHFRLTLNCEQIENLKFQLMQKSIFLDALCTPCQPAVQSSGHSP